MPLEHSARRSVSGAESVSVVIPCYNHERFIEQAIRSAANQDIEDLEVIVSDDASDDESLRISQEVGASYPPGRVRVLSTHVNRGQCANVNAAISEAKGDFIAFLDSDDFFRPGKISKQLQWFKETTNATLCATSVDLVDEFGQTIQTSLPIAAAVTGNGAGALLKYGAIFAACSVMVRRNCIPKKGFDERLDSADWSFQIEVLLQGGSFATLTESLACWRQHPHQMTRQSSAACLMSVFRGIRYLDSEHPELSIELKAHREYRLKLLCDELVQDPSPDSRLLGVALFEALDCERKFVTTPLLKLAAMWKEEVPAYCESHFRYSDDCFPE
jgi:Glycosyl transferase family 2